MILEVFSCSGGMAEGLRREGLEPDLAFDKDADAVASYTRNLGKAPVQMDARDLLRMVEMGWRPSEAIDLFVADPPCTPWSRAGKRQGMADERDMLAVTVELVRLLRPTSFLIANVPGLDDGPNWPTVQKTIGSLSKGKDGYCVDFVRLDAASYGVPQHRIRPFWFGHGKDTPHVDWPAPTHCDPKEMRTHHLPGCAMIPWVTCRQALSHLAPEDLGAPVRLRWRGANGKQVASVPDQPARVVGTSNLSDGNVLAHPTEATRKAHKPSRKPRETPIESKTAHRATTLDEPAKTITRNTHGDGALLSDEDLVKLAYAVADDEVVFSEPDAAVLILRERSDGTIRESTLDAPAHTLRGGRSSSERLMVEVPHHPPSNADEPSRTIRAGTECTPDKLLKLGEATVSSKHPPNDPDAPSVTVRGGGRGHAAPAVVLATNDKHPPNTLDAPSSTLSAKGDRGGQGSTVLVTGKHPVSDADEPGMTVSASDGGGSKKVMAWPWDRPGTVVHSDPGARLAPPGHHGKSSMTDNRGHGPNAVKLSEKAAAILQGFPEGWVFAGETKRARWSQIGQAMPPPLAAAVARSIRRQKEIVAAMQRGARLERDLA